MSACKILIIDDEKDYCMIMKSYFVRKKYDVSLAYTLKDGYHLLEEKRPDVLLLDNNLPDGKGKEQIDNILEKYPSLRIYLISAYHQKNDFIEPRDNLTVWEKPIQLTLLDETFQ